MHLNTKVQIMIAITLSVLIILLVPKSVQAAFVVVWCFVFIASIYILGKIPSPEVQEMFRRDNETRQRALRLEQTLQKSCRHLTRLSSVVVTCGHCGERFLKLESTPTVSCSGCGRAVLRQREPSAICDIDGSRVSKEQLTDCFYSHEWCKKRGEVNTIYLD